MSQANMLFCPVNAFDQATLYAEPTALETMPVSNLQLPWRGPVFGSTSTATQKIKATWNGQGAYLTYLALYRFNLSTSATIRIQVFSDAAWTNQIYDSGFVSAYEAVPLGSLNWGVTPLGSSIFDGFRGLRFKAFYFNRVLAGSVVITINDAGNTEGILTCSRLHGGDAHTLQWNPNSLEFGWSEGTEQRRNPMGALRGEAEESFRAGAVKIEFTDEAQRQAYNDLMSVAGLRKDVFLSIFPGAGGRLERDHTLICKLVGRLPKVSQRGNNSVKSIDLAFEEST